MNSVNMNNNEDNNDEVEQQVDNMYDNFVKKEEPQNQDNSKSNNVKESEGYHYQEKEYNNNYLETHTVVAKASKISRIFLLTFYGIVLIVGVFVFFMLRADKYEIYLPKKDVTISKGSSYQVELTPKNAHYFDYLNYDYKMANENVATVDEYGIIKALDAGSTTLTISKGIGFVAKTITVNVDDSPISSVDLISSRESDSGNDINLVPNQSIALTAVPNKNKNVNASAKYESSDKSIATVDDFGNVTAKKEGTVTIVGKVNGTIGETQINVTSSVSTSTIQSIKLDSSISLKVGNAVMLIPTISPESLSSSPLSWTSSDESVATVSNTGLVVSKKTGTTIITVTSSNGKKATCNINVTSDNVNVSSISLNVSKRSINVGKTYQLKVTISPSNATNRDITWTSSNISVATVSNTGLVTGKKAGTTTITATSSNGKKATCTVTVVKATSTTTSSTTTPSTSTTTTTTTATKIDIGISRTSKYVGENLSLVPTITPSSVSTSKVKWSSSDTSVATVSQSGKVSTHKNGTAIITATVDGVSDTCTLTVLNKPAASTPATTEPTTQPVTPTAPSGTQFKDSGTTKLSTTSLTIGNGQSKTFDIKLKSASGTFIVSSSDTSVITISAPSGGGILCNNLTCSIDAYPGDGEVSATFTVTAHAKGTAKITVKYSDVVQLDSNYNEIATLNGTGEIGVLVN